MQRIKSNKKIEKEIGRRLTLEEVGILNRLRILNKKEKLESWHAVAGRTDSEIIQQKNIEEILRNKGIKSYW